MPKSTTPCPPPSHTLAECMLAFGLNLNALPATTYGRSTFGVRAVEGVPNGVVLPESYTVSLRRFRSGMVQS